MHIKTKAPSCVEEGALLVFYVLITPYNYLPPSAVPMVIMVMIIVLLKIMLCM
jgi:hypothetical protein